MLEKENGSGACHGVGCRVVNVRVETPDVYIGRPSVWGNPFRLTAEAARGSTLAKYRVWLWKQIEGGRITLSDLRGLDGKSLGCYCAPRPCHGNVLAAAVSWAMGQPDPTDEVALCNECDSAPAVRVARGGERNGLKCEPYASYTEQQWAEMDAARTPYQSSPKGV